MLPVASPAPWHLSSSSLALGPLLLLLFLGSSSLSPAWASTSNQPPPPERDPDLICPSSDPQECYPRIFQPTDEFQLVRRDQQLPKGLHVRLNIWTGEREAKRNSPHDPPQAALDGLPPERAVVVVDANPPDALGPAKKASKDDGSETMEKPAHELPPFLTAALDALRSPGPVNDDKLREGLDQLQELAHDMDYGLKIAEQPAIVADLLCLMTDWSDADTAQAGPPRDQRAAEIMAAALQNNPAALAEVAKAWPGLRSFQCAPSDRPLADRLYSSFLPPRAMTGRASRQLASRVKTKVSLLNGLLKDASLREEFIQGGGMRQLLKLLLLPGKEWAEAQRRAGELALDNFLDQDMGAQTGQWPREPRLSEGQCRAEAESPPEGCWDYQVARIMAAHRRHKDHWSSRLHSSLAAARSSQERRPSDRADL